MHEQKPGDKSVKLEEAVSSGLHKAPVLPVLSAVCRGLGYICHSIPQSYKTLRNKA